MSNRAGKAHKIVSGESGSRGSGACTPPHGFINFNFLAALGVFALITVLVCGYVLFLRSEAPEMVSSGSFPGSARSDAASSEYAGDERTVKALELPYVPTSHRDGNTGEEVYSGGAPEVRADTAGASSSVHPSGSKGPVDPAAGARDAVPSSSDPTPAQDLPGRPRSATQAHPAVGQTQTQSIEAKSEEVRADGPAADNQPKKENDEAAGSAQESKDASRREVTSSSEITESTWIEAMLNVLRSDRQEQYPLASGIIRQMSKEPDFPLLTAETTPEEAKRVADEWEERLKKHSTSNQQLSTQGFLTADEGR